MAHAAHAPGTRGTPRTGTSTPDVLSERTHRTMRWALPVVLGLVYGYWVAALDRFDGPSAGPITGANLLLGLLSALAFMVLHLAVRAVARHRGREAHALTWAAFAGVAFGFLYSQNGGTWVRATGLSLLIALAVFAVNHYRSSTRADAEGRRTG